MNDQQLRRRSRSRLKGRCSSKENRPIRVWIPGSFDFLHHRQVSFLRKVKHEMSLRFPKVELVLGLYSDQSLTDVGRKPVFSMHERFDMVRANKWVDDIVKDAPMQLSTDVLKEYGCDYAFLYAEPGAPPQYDHLKDELMTSELLKTVTWSRGDYSDISAMDMINRIFLLEPKDDNNNTKSGRNWKPQKFTFPFSITSKELLHLTTGNTPKPASTDKVVYVGGSFDVLHPGHLKLLEKAQSLGNFVIVGLHSDETISKYAGKNFPVMHWNERLMALLSVRYVSEIIIDAPLEINESLLEAFKVNCVLPSPDDYGCFGNDGSIDASNANNPMITDQYAVAKQSGIFHDDEAIPVRCDDNDEAAIDKENFLTTADILKRVHDNWSAYSYDPMSA